MIKFIKTDYKRVKEVWEYKLGRKIPNAIFMPIYVPIAIIMIPIAMFILAGLFIYMKINK